MSKKRLKIPDFDLMQNLVIESHRLRPGKSEDKIKTLVANESQTNDLSSSSRKQTQRATNESPYGLKPKVKKIDLSKSNVNMVNEYEFSGPNSAVYYPNESQRTDSVEKMFS